MVCKHGDNLNILDFDRNLDMKPFHSTSRDVLYYIKVSNLYKVLISKFNVRNTPLWTRHQWLCLTSLRNYLAVLIRLPKSYFFIMLVLG